MICYTVFNKIKVTYKNKNVLYIWNIKKAFYIYEYSTKFLTNETSFISNFNQREDRVIWLEDERLDDTWRWMEWWKHVIGGGILLACVPTAVELVFSYKLTK